jgi:hypothetical protein
LSLHQQDATWLAKHWTSANSPNLQKTYCPASLCPYCKSPDETFKYILQCKAPLVAKAQYIAQTKLSSLSKQLGSPPGRFYIRCFVTGFKMKHPCLNWYFLKAGQRPLLETALRSPNQDKNNWVYYAMKLNVLMKIKPLRHFPLTISCWATKGSGKRREEYDYLASMYPGVLAGLLVSGTDCTTWQRVVSSWRDGFVWAVVVLMDSFALVFWEQ